MLFMILRILVPRAFDPSGFIQAKGLNLVVGLRLRAVSVFGKKSTAVCGFSAYFCAVLRFLDPPYAPLTAASGFSQGLQSMPKGNTSPQEFSVTNRGGDW